MKYSVYSCGSNGNFQLGNKTDIDLNKLSISYFDEESVLSNRPVKIIGGGNHTLVLFENGEMYSSGLNEFGQCGYCDELQVKSFRRIPFVNGIKWVNGSCGWNFSILVNENNEIYSCGEGLNGELGLGREIRESMKKEKEEKDVSAVRRVDIDGVLNEKNWRGEVRIKDVKSSLDHTIVMLSNNKTVGWGNNKKNQMSLSELKEDKVLWEPALVDMKMLNNGDNGNDNGNDNDSEEEMIVTNYSLGRNFSIIGNKKDKKIRIISKSKTLAFNNNDNLVIEDIEFEDIKTMWSSFHLFLNEKEIVSIGNNRHKQKFPLEDMKNKSGIDIDEFEVGSEHGVILDKKSNRVYSWGWGEHGN
ncbi:Ats1p, partial [Ascoidea rubescens DSM 1968]